MAFAARQGFMEEGGAAAKAIEKERLSAALSEKKQIIPAFSEMRSYPS